MVAYSAYFDESKDRDRGVLAIAGYVAPTAEWDALSKPLQVVLDTAPRPLKEFKAADCTSGHGEFETWTRRERSALRGSLISTLVNNGRVIGIGAAALIDYSMADTKKRRTQLERAAYLWCLAFVMQDVLSVVRTRLEQDSLQVVFDEERHMQHRIGKMFEVARELFAKDWQGMVPDLQFGQSHNLLPLQAADLFVYETFRAAVNHKAGLPRKPRQPLRRLLRGAVHAAKYFNLRDYLVRPAGGWSGIQQKFLFDSRPLHRGRPRIVEPSRQVILERVYAKPQVFYRTQPGSGFKDIEPISPGEVISTRDECASATANSIVDFFLSAEGVISGMQSVDSGYGSLIELECAEGVFLQRGDEKVEIRTVLLVTDLAKSEVAFELEAKPRRSGVTYGRGSQDNANMTLAIFEEPYPRSLALVVRSEGQLAIEKIPVDPKRHLRPATGDTMGRLFPPGSARLSDDDPAS